MPISPRKDILSENESVLRGVRISKLMPGNVAGGCTGGGGEGGGGYGQKGVQMPASWAHCAPKSLCSTRINIPASTCH